eukprot:PITA_25799
MAETLSLHLENKRKLKEITGVDTVRGTKGINHSLFADDTLLIGGASSLMARRFKSILDLFLQASGGKLNNSKCMVYTWNVPRFIAQRISMIMEIPTQSNWSHFMYLGLPLAKEAINTEVWVKLVEKLRGKMQSWGVYWLNLAGRTTLIKAILSALPIYQFATIIAPASIHKHMELIIRSFLWKGGSKTQKSPAWLNGKRDLVDRGPQEEYLNGSNSNILTETITDRQCTPVWKLIKKTLPLFKPSISKAPGNGNHISIWEDRIMGTEARETSSKYRPLQQWMAEANLKTLSDISLWDQNGWVGWRSLSLPIGISNLWDDLKLSLIGSAPTNRSSDDKYVWDPNGGSYTVKEGYKALQNASATTNWHLYKPAWRTESLPKVKLFNWTLLHGKILTAENLRKKGIQGPSICCMCRRAEESSDHLFIDCPVAKSCWNLITSPLIIEDLPNQISLLQKGWGKSFPYTNKNMNLAKRMWNSIPSNLCWHIWIARNKCIFNNKKPSISSILAKTTALITETVETNGISQADSELTYDRVKEWM